MVADARSAVAYPSSEDAACSDAVAAVASAAEVADETAVASVAEAIRVGSWAVAASEAEEEDREKEAAVNDSPAVLVAPDAEEGVSDP